MSLTMFRSFYEIAEFTIHDRPSEASNFVETVE